MSDYFLADDLSGALDAAAAFHHAGRRVRILLRQEPWTASDPSEFIAITTETRNASPGEAAATVRRVLARARALGARLRYKKIDSTLRGPIAAELEAIMDALPDARVLFAPANPAVGRTVRGGVLQVNDVPVADTPFGQDPGSPLRTSKVREILGAAANGRVTIPDVATENDLRTAVDEMKAGAAEWIPVGSGALAAVVARAGAGASIELPRPSDVAVPMSPILMLGGSAHPLNRSQIELLRHLHQTPAHEIAFADPQVAARGSAASLRTVGGAVLHLPATRVDRAAALNALVAAATAAMEEADVHRVFITGGETAFALCDRLSVKSLVFISEIEPGLSLSIGESKLGPLLIAVKPGGFGDEQTWVRAWTALRAHPAPGC